jgi:hypothetical protein
LRPSYPDSFSPLHDPNYTASMDGTPLLLGGIQKLHIPAFNVEININDRFFFLLNDFLSWLVCGKTPLK